MKEHLARQWEQAAQRHLEVARLVFEAGFYGQAMASCYFAMMAAATALLVKEGLEVKTHPGVHNQLYRVFVRSRAVLTTDHTRLLSRSQADRRAYHYYNWTFSREEAEQRLAEARAFAEDIRAIL